MDWLKEFVAYENAFIEDVQGLLAIRSIRDDTTKGIQAPFGAGCREALDYMFSLAKRDGFTCIDYDGYAGVISFGEGEKSVGVLAHLDVVPEGVGWSMEPFHGTIVDGCLFGRGVLDDKGPAMAAYYALKMLRDKGIQPKKKIMLILGCDEESGMSCMKHYVQHGQIPDIGFTPDADFPVIYGEKGGLLVHMHGDVETIIESMYAGERSNIVIGEAKAVVKRWEESYETLFDFYLKANNLEGEIRVEDGKKVLFMKGIFAHGAMPYKGVNAALHLLNFIGTATQDAFAKDTYRLLCDWQGKGMGIDHEGAVMGFLTMNTGKISIGEGHADIVVDIRYPNDVTKKELDAEIHQALYACHYPLQVTLDYVANPLYVDPTSALVQTLTTVYQQYSEDYTTPNMTIGGGTYAKQFKNFVAFGPAFPKRSGQENGLIGGCHQSDEGMLLSELFKAVAIYTEAIKQLASMEITK